MAAAAAPYCGFRRGPETFGSLVYPDPRYSATVFGSRRGARKVRLAARRPFRPSCRCASLGEPGRPTYSGGTHLGFPGTPRRVGGRVRRFLTTTEGSLAATQRIQTRFSNHDFWSPRGLFPRGTHQLRWAAKPPTSIDGFPKDPHPPVRSDRGPEDDFSCVFIELYVFVKWLMTSMAQAI